MYMFLKMLFFITLKYVKTIVPKNVNTAFQENYSHKKSHYVKYYKQYKPNYFMLQKSVILLLYIHIVDTVDLMFSRVINC